MKNNEPKMFQIEWDEEVGRVEVHLNSQGIDYFISILEKLKQRNAPDDIHLMTPEWGGDGLTSCEDSGENKIVNSLKLLKW